MSQVERLDRAAASRYLRKSEEFLRSADEASRRSDWNATGLGAIHAGLSATDAFLVWVHGVRSTAKDHMEVARVLRRLGGEEVAVRASALERLVSKKNVVEYEHRLFSAREARDALTRAERLVAWARESLKEA